MGRRWVHAEKSLRAEADLPRDVVQVLWDYDRFQPEILRRLRRRGFEVWVAPGRDPAQIARWDEAVRRVGSPWCDAARVVELIGSAIAS